MSNDDDISKAFADVAERLKREAYAAGWRDAMTAITNAVAQLGEQEGASEGVKIDFTPGPPLVLGAPNEGPSVGTTPWYVWQAVKKRPGMTGSEIINVVREGGHKASPASIRTSINRVKARKLIISRHGKWFPA